MATKTATASVKPVKPVKSDADVLAAREKEIVKQYKKVLPGSIRRETDGHHAGKITVETSCAEKGCSEKRRIATSDLFQCKFCPDCTALNRVKARKAKVKAEAAAKPVKPTKPAVKPPVKKEAPIAKPAKPKSKKTQLALPSLAEANNLAHTPLPAPTDSVTDLDELVVAEPVTTAS